MPDRLQGRMAIGGLAGALACAGLLATVGVPAAQAAPGSTPPAVTVVASGLNNPRSVTWADGKLYVAEAGKGGSDCPAGLTGPDGGPTCVGRTGSIAQIDDGTAHNVVSGLFSMAGHGGIGAEGVMGLQATRADDLTAVFGESVAGVFASLPKGTSFTPADTAAARAQLGRLATVDDGKLRLGADVGGSDYAWSGRHKNLVPDQFPDANPNYVKVVGDTTYVIDSGSNTLDSVNEGGHVRQLAFIPNPPHRDAVPTCVDRGPDGALYIGQLAPAAAPGTGNIYRFDPHTRALSVWKTGFNVVDGCGFDNSGNFYAVEFQAHGFNPSPSGNPAGDIIKISPTGTRTVLGAGQLFYPQGFTHDDAGNIYVSNWSIFPGTAAHPGMPTGQVVRLRG